MNSKVDSKDSQGSEELPSYTEVASSTNNSNSSTSTAKQPSTCQPQLNSNSTTSNQSGSGPSHTITLPSSAPNAPINPSAIYLLNPEARREISSRTRSRFWKAFFFAWAIWLIISLLTGGVVDEAIKQGQREHRRKHHGNGADWIGNEKVDVAPASLWEYVRST